MLFLNFSYNSVQKYKKNRTIFIMRLFIFLTIKLVNYFFALRFIMSLASGVASNIDEKVPMKIPTVIANTNPRITSPPKSRITTSVTSVVTEVFIVRPNVELSAKFITDFESAFGLRANISRIRSKITTVLLIE